MKQLLPRLLSIISFSFLSHSLAYEAPPFSEPNSLIFIETFQSISPKCSKLENQNDPFCFGWIESKDSDYSSQEISISDYNSAFPGDNSIYLKKKHVRYGVSKKLDKPFLFGGDNDDVDETDEVVVQFETRFQNDVTCSGAYIKFVSEDEASGVSQEEFNEKTPYVLMFGPDKCGGTNKVHLIFRHQNPVTKEYEEKHFVSKVKVPTDKLPHLYTLKITGKSKDPEIKILIDGEEKASGKLLDRGVFQPDFEALEMIDDPDDKKPDDWEDKAKIADPEAVKPADWDDEPEKIEDPEAKMPEDWNEEEDGKWEIPMIPNPKYKGKWRAPMIDNPNYKGKWAPKKIPNPNYFKQENPLKHLSKVGFAFIEVLANDANITFDNILISNKISSAEEFAEKTFKLKSKLQKEIQQENDLKQQKEEREKKLEDDFGFWTVLEYAMGEVNDFIIRNTVTAMISGGLLLLFLIYAVFFRQSKSRPVATAEARHKKDDDAAEGEEVKAENIPEEEDEEPKIEEESEEDKSSIRKRSAKKE